MFCHKQIHSVPLNDDINRANLSLELLQLITNIFKLNKCKKKQPKTGDFFTFSSLILVKGNFVSD